MGGSAGQFEDEWPQLAGRLRVALSARGVDPWLLDDVVQETGLRLFKMWEKVDPSRSPWGLTLKIATNLLWDHAHDKQRGEVVGNVPDVQDDHDTERAALARLELSRVRRALPLLSPSHRAVLLAEVGFPSTVTGRTQSALKVLRMRARRHLAALMDQASTFGVTLGWNVRQLAWRVLEPIKRNLTLAEPNSHSTAAGVLALAALLTLPSLDASLPRSTGSGSSSANPPVVFYDTAPAISVRPPARLALADQGLVVAADRKLHKTRDGSEGGRDYRIGVGDGGPAQAEAGIRVIPDDNDRRTLANEPPACTIAGSRRLEVTAECRAKTFSREARADGRVRLRP